MLRPHFAGEIVVGEIGPVIGTHAGRGTIGVAFSTPRLSDAAAQPSTPRTDCPDRAVRPN